MKFTEKTSFVTGCNKFAPKPSFATVSGFAAAPRFPSEPIFSLVIYYGGKHYLAPKILYHINRLADHCNATTYIECCGGGARCLLNLNQIRHKFKHKIYSEWDETLCCLFFVAKDEATLLELVAYLKSLEYSISYAKADPAKMLAHYQQVYADHDYELDEKTGLVLNKNVTTIQKAASAYLTCRLSMNGERDGCSWDKIKGYRNQFDNLMKAPDHLRNLSVRQGDFMRVVEEYGWRTDVVIYIDPPYHFVTRAKGSHDVYPKEMDPNEHRAMVELLCKVKCAWIMSGYDPADGGCYDYEVFNRYGVEKICLGEVNVSSGNSSNAKAGKDMRKQTEWLWCKKASI